MPITLVVVLLRIVVLAAAVFILPRLLRLVKNYLITDTWKTCIRVLLAVYLGAVFLATFGLRLEVNGAGVILDFTWGYKIISRAFIAGYEAGGLSEAIRRLSWVRETISSLILNVILFVPFGYLVPLSFRRMTVWWRVLAAGFTLSICIEVVQYLTQTGWFDVSDPIYNSLGAIAGFFSYRRLFGNEEISG